MAKKGDLKPYQIRYWLPPVHKEPFEEKVADVCGLYQAAPDLAAQGEWVVSTDELTGVQALEQAKPGLPLQAGRVERREFEYIRHGARTFILNWDVANGRVIAPSAGPTRTEADFVRHSQNTVASAPLVTRWHIVVDNLNTHCSEALVRWVAAESDLAIDLGVKGQHGILATCQSRAAFLSAPSHRIVFHYTPKHAEPN